MVDLIQYFRLGEIWCIIIHNLWKIYFVPQERHMLNSKCTVSANSNWLLCMTVHLASSANYPQMVLIFSFN